MQSINVKSPHLQKNKAPPPIQSKCKLQFSYQPSPDNVDYNLLILFHGLGDSMGPFNALAKKLALPQTATLAVQAPLTVPYLDGFYQWYPSFDIMTGNLLPPSRERMDGLLRTRKMVNELLQHLTTYCGFESNRVFLFGFSQGATVALDTALFGEFSNLGGVVSVSGYLLEEHAAEKQKNGKYGGMILVTQGDKDETVKKPDAEKKFRMIQSLCRDPSQATLTWISGKDHSMPKGPDEWGQIIQFFAEQMPRRNLELENMADVYLDANGMWHWDNAQAADGI